MIIKTHPLPVKRQAELLEISRSNVYYLPAPTPERDLALMRAIDELHLEYPFLGARQLSKILAREGHPYAGRLHVGTLMAKMGITALYRKPNTSKRHPGHKIYPYLLRYLAIERADHVWAMDITYLPMQRGFIYLAVVMDWATRRVLAWRVSNTLTADFCVEAVDEAIARYGKPEIFNTDQGTQFTSDAFTRRSMVTGWRSAWTAAVAGVTTCSWNGSGVRSNTKGLPSRLRQRQRGQSRCQAVSSSPTVDARTPRSATEPPTRHTSPNKP